MARISARATPSLRVGPELLSPDEMALADRLAIAGGVSGIALMERAGGAVAAAAGRMWRAGRVVVLAGPGNNGGDGFVAARLLRERGYRVTVALFGERRALGGDAAIAAGRFAGEVHPARPDVFPGAGLIVDALYGAGVRLPLPAAAQQLIGAANAAGAPILAVDLPSGVEGGGGAAGDAAIRATETVTFFRLKPGHLLYPGRGLCGRVTVADIGIAPGCLATIGPRTFRNVPELWQDHLPQPRAEGHKYDRGHALVVSGPPDATGAARLAARAALRIGAGLVTVASPPDALATNAFQLTAIMVRGFDGAGGLAALLEDRRKNGVVLGPGLGLGAATRDLVRAALSSVASVVLDADALTGFAGDAEGLFTLTRQRSAATVLTPHGGEFARLFPEPAAGGISRLARAREAAAASGAVLILKGPDTVVAAPDGRAAIAANAPPWLATAGAGDVLAGMVTGLLVQGMPAFEAASAAVWLHGEAAAFGPGLIAEDLETMLPEVLSRTGRGVASQGQGEGPAPALVPGQAGLRQG